MRPPWVTADEEGMVDWAQRMARVLERRWILETSGARLASVR